MKRSHLRGLYRSDFRTFISFAFRELYPEKVFVDGWYLDIVCDELMRCGPDGNRRLILNLPPRYLKSFCASIAWPLFMAARHSGMRICESGCFAHHAYSRYFRNYAFETRATL